MTRAVTSPNKPASPKENIRLVGVEKRFGDQVAIKNLSLDINDRELLVVLGPSGSGKTTTLNLLAGLETPTAGDIYFGEERVTNVPAENRNISMVFQSVTLYPNKNVQENILFALKLAKVPQEVQEQRLREITRLLGIDRYLARPIHQLSGGERQRVAIAKALVKRSRLFILDEPFSSLDAELRRELRGELVRIHRELETTMLFVTHDQEEALSIADRIALMNRGELVQLGPALEIYERPATQWVASFVGPHRINLLDADFRRDDGGAMIETAVGRRAVDEPLAHCIQQTAPSSRVVVGVRPEFADLAAQPRSNRSIPVEVYTRQHLGNEVLYHLKSADTTLRAVAPAMHQFQIGDSLYFDFAWDHALWFDATSGKRIDTSGTESIHQAANATAGIGQ